MKCVTCNATKDARRCIEDGVEVVICLNCRKSRFAVAEAIRRTKEQSK